MDVVWEKWSNRPQKEGVVEAVTATGQVRSSVIINSYCFKSNFTSESWSHIERLAPACLPDSNTDRLMKSGRLSLRKWRVNPEDLAYTNYVYYFQINGHMWFYDCHAHGKRNMYLKLVIHYSPGLRNTENAEFSNGLY